MTSPTIRLPYLYPLEYLPLRGQKARTVLVTDVAEFELRDVSRSEVVDAIALAGPGGGVSRYGYGDDLFALYVKEGHEDIQGFGEIPMKLRAAGIRETARLFGDRVGEGPWTHAAGWERALPERPGDLRTVVRDGRDETLAMLRRKVDDLLVMDGNILVKRPPPMLCLLNTGSRGWAANVQEDPVGIRFGIDRPEAFDAFVERFMDREKVRVTRPSLRPLAIDWDLSRYSEAVPNAEYCASSIVWSAGQILGTLPSACLHVVATIAEAREAIVAGAGLERATAIREMALRILELHPVKEGTLLRKALGNAIDAIESSRDFGRVDLDADDVEALDGIVMSP